MMKLELEDFWGTMVSVWGIYALFFFYLEAF